MSHYYFNVRYNIMEVIIDDRPCQLLINLIKYCHEINFISAAGSGVLFRLTTTRDKTNYYDENGTKITNYIIKIVSLSETPLSYYITDKPRQKTSTEKASSFLKEAQVQQSIWKRCISKGTPVFSPSVLNLSLFKGKRPLSVFTRSDRPLPNTDQANSFLRLLNSKIKDSSSKYFIEKYIEFVINFAIFRHHEVDVGVLLMPEIKNAVSLQDISLQNIPAYINTIVNILELYLFHGIIHLDLHEGNILIERDDDMSSKLIDFGEIMQININSDSDLKRKRQSRAGKHQNISATKKSKKEMSALPIIVSQKSVLTADTDEDAIIYFTNQRETKLANFATIVTDPKKIEFVEQICKSMSEYDKSRAGTELNAQGELKNYKMKWIESIYRNEEVKPIVFLNAFNKLKEIKEKENKKPFPENTFNLDNDDTNNYYCNENIIICQPIKVDNTPQEEESRSICNIMGGRIKLSKKKKHHILKKKRRRSVKKQSVKNEK